MTAQRQLLAAAILVVLTATAATCRESGPSPAPAGAATGSSTGAASPPAATPAPPPTTPEEPLLPSLTLHPSGGAAVALSVELARTARERARGLMFRRSLPADRGMLFVFEEEGDWPFYMKNTYIPLDLIYIDSDGRVVGCLEDLRPFDETARSVAAPARYVLEVNAGSVRRWGLRPGDRVDLPGGVGP